MSQIKLSIIIVTFNSAPNISALLDSLKSIRLTTEIIIIDNASQDETVRVIKSHPLRNNLIENKINLGFSKAVNIGIKQSSGEFVLLLNPDTIVVGNSLLKMVEFASSTKPLGAVVPRLLDYQSKPQASVYKFPTIINAIKKDFLGCKNCFGKYLPSNRIQKVEVAVMAAFLIPRDTINTIGILNEAFFLYCEDFDYCRRLKVHHLPLYYFPQAKVKHQHGASGHFVYHLKSPLLKSAQTYYGKHYSDFLNFILWLGHKWQVILRRKKFRD